MILLEILFLWFVLRIILYGSTLLKEPKWYIPLYTILFIATASFAGSLLEWPYMISIFIISVLSLSLLSLLRMILKPNKTILSYIKYVWGILFPIGYLFRLYHWQGGHTLLFISAILLLLIFLVFVNTNYLNKRSSNKNDESTP